MSKRLDKTREYLQHNYNDLQAIADSIGAHYSYNADQTIANIDHLITYDKDLLTVAVKKIGQLKRIRTLRNKNNDL